MIKKHLCSIKTCHTNILMSLFCLLSLSFISACDNGSGNDQNETGSVSFQIQWPGDDTSGVSPSQWHAGSDIFGSAETGIMAANVTVSEDCNSRGIVTVSVQVRDAYENLLVSKNFDCDLGVGKILVPVGSGRMFIISGLDADGNVRYHGQKTGVTILAGSNDIGTIQMERNSEFCTDNDGDGYYTEKDCGTAVDCNDNDKNIYPGAIEICGDGIDQDSDGKDELCQDSLLQMWYWYQNGYTDLIGYATSSNGLDWSTSADNPVLSGMAPCVIKDGNTYKMWYWYQNGYTDLIGYATSINGLDWSTSADNPVLSDCFTPCVIKDDNTYKMWNWYQNGYTDLIGYATSSNGVDWSTSADNPVLSGMAPTVLLH